MSALSGLVFARLLVLTCLPVLARLFVFVFMLLGIWKMKNGTLGTVGNDLGHLDLRSVGRSDMGSGEPGAPDH